MNGNDWGAGGGGWYGGASTKSNNGGGGGGSGYLDASLYNARTMTAAEGYPQVSDSSKKSNEDSFNGAPYNGYARITYVGTERPEASGD